MPEFWYQALTVSGALREGWMSAPDVSDVEERLRAGGAYLVSAEVRMRPERARARTDGAVDRRELLAFFEYLAGSFEVGIPILTTMTDVEARLQSRRLRRIVAEVRSAMADEGLGLSAALAEHPKAFPPLFVSTIQAGEASGQLGFSLRQLVEYMDWQEDIATQLRQATTYPIIVLTAISALVLLLVGFVFPKLLPVLTARNVELPLPTRIVMAASFAVREHWLTMLVAAGVLIAGVWLVRRSDAGRERTDWVLLHLPVVGSLLHEVNMARLVTYLGLFYRTGVEIVLALTLVERIVTNRVVARAVGQAREAIVGGETMASAFGRLRVFAPMVVRSIALGEVTGRLDEALGRATAYYTREVPASVRRMTTALQPVLVVTMGAMILLVALAIFLPILSIYGSVGVVK